MSGLLTELVRQFLSGSAGYRRESTTAWRLSLVAKLEVTSAPPLEICMDEVVFRLERQPSWPNDPFPKAESVHASELGSGNVNY